MSERKDPQILKTLAIRMGWIPQEPFLNTSIPIECLHKNCGRISKKSFNSIQQKKGCKFCKNDKGDADKYIKVMLKAKLEPLEPYTSAHVNWKCKCLVCDSIVTPKYSTVQSKGAGCKTCRYSKIREYHVLTIEDVIELVSARGGKLVSSEYINIDSPLVFECSKGHEFTNSFNHVKNDRQWCPICSKGSKSEEIARTTFEQLFKHKFKKYRPKWLRNQDGFLMELDGFCPELKIGFEYHGVQHFKKNFYQTGIEKRKRDDEKKEELCRQNGIKLFILTYKMKYEDFQKEIKRQASTLGVVLPGDFDSISIDIERAYIRNDRINELKELLAPKHIQVISSKYLGSNQDVELRCLICLHKWKAKGNMFFNSRRVAGCDKCNRRKAGERNRLTMNELREFAKIFQGELLSSEYTGTNVNYLWKCKNGHEFERRFSNMKNRNIFCPFCEGKRISSRNRVRAIGETHSPKKD